MTCSTFQLQCRCLGTSGVLILLFLLVLGIGGSACLVTGIYNDLPRDRVAGVVIDKGLSGNPKLGPKDKNSVLFWVKYSFSGRQGQSHQNQGYVAKEQWDRLQQGSEVPVEYKQGDERNSWLAFEDAGPSITAGTYFAIGFGIFLIFLSVAGTFALLRALYRQVLLIRDGTPAVGNVTQVISKELAPAVKGGEPSVSLHLQFRFVDTEGAEYFGESDSLPRATIDRWPVGSAILVLYKAENPSERELDLYDARSDDLARLLGGTVQ